jgi:glycolate oxidase FAD binding subunit
MAETLRPGTPEQVAEAVAWAAAEEAPLEIAGRGSKRDLGRPVQASHELDLSGLSGITLYEAEELVLTARAGTPLAEIEAALAEHRQQLAFEPADLGPLLGGPPGAGSIGGVLACNLSGQTGGRVVKNVTGYDLCKLLAGSHGTLAVMTEVTVKVLPAAEKTRTVLIYGLDDRTALKAMTLALQSSHEVSGAAHLPDRPAASSQVSYVAEPGRAVTAIRVEGPGPSVEYRCAALRRELGALGESEELHGRNSAALWRELRDVAPFVGDPERPVWRLSVPPQDGPAVAGALADGREGRYFFDWGGGLLWLCLPQWTEGAPDQVRAAVASRGGHATLIRAGRDVRASVPVFQPQDPALFALTRRVKESFDPRRILNPGRMYAGV